MPTKNWKNLKKKNHHTQLKWRYLQLNTIYKLLLAIPLLRLFNYIFFTNYSTANKKRLTLSYSTSDNTFFENDI